MADTETTAKTYADELNEFLASGGAVIVTTYNRATEYGAKHAGWFTCDSDGSLFVKYGKGRNRLSIGKRMIVGIKTGRYV